jgi:hypothetical protein
MARFHRFSAALAASSILFASVASAQTYEAGVTRGVNLVPNQQFRADIMMPGSDAFDVGAQVLANVYQTDPGDPLVSGYSTVTFDLSAYAGQTIRIRFAEVDNQNFFQAGVDNVAILDGPGGSSTGTVTNGGFETNGGAGTSSLSGWSIIDQAGGSPDGSWYAQTGTTSPVSSFTVQAPPAGSFAAMTDQTGAGSHVLYQEVTVPASGGVLTFDLYLANRALDFFVPSPPTLAWDAAIPPSVPVPAMSPAAIGSLILLLGLLAAFTLVLRRTS